MKIIEDGRAPNPRRVRIFVAEKGIEVSYEQLDIMAGEHMEGPAAALNPMRRVPILVLDDGTAISESMAICRYFEAEQPLPKLFGSSAKEIATIDMWNRRMELGLLFHVAQCFRHLHPAMKELEVPQVKEWGEANRPKILAMLRILDEQLADRPYVAGDMFSVADITALVAVDFMKLTRTERPADLVHLERWHGDVSSRPSASA